MNGGVSKEDLENENLDAVQRGSSNLIRHLENILKFGVPVVVAINHFLTDTNNEIELIKKIVHKVGVQAVECKHWATGSKGIEELAKNA